MMLIFNQDKTVVANIQQAEAIGVVMSAVNNNGVIWHAIAHTAGSSQRYWLGDYPDRKTAQAALAQLVEAYQAGWRVFNMPSDGEEDEHK